MDNEEVKNKIQSLLDTIIQHTGISVNVDISDSVRNDRQHFSVDMESEESSLLIGYHGENLNSLQHYISSALHRQFDGDFTVLVDISGYRAEREKKLQHIAENASEKAVAMGRPVGLYPMNSYERKVIHEKVSDIDGVTSASEEEGRDRRVVISPVEDS